MIPTFHRVRVWHPHSAKINEKWFIKNEVVLGCGDDCHFKIDIDAAIGCRIDLQHQEMRDLITGKSMAIKPGEIFQFQNHVIQWTPITLNKKRKLMGFLGGLILLVAFSAFLLFSSSASITCKLNNVSHIKKEELQKLAPYETSFVEALKFNNFIKARIELDSIREIISTAVDARCPLPEIVNRFEGRLAWAQFRDAIKRSSLEQAATEVVKLKELESSFHILAGERLSKLARRLYIKAYKLEDKDPVAAQDLMDKVQSICIQIGYSEKCLKQRTFSETVPSLAQQSPE